MNEHLFELCNNSIPSNFVEAAWQLAKDKIDIKSLLFSNFLNFLFISATININDDLLVPNADMFDDNMINLNNYYNEVIIADTLTMLHHLTNIYDLCLQANPVYPTFYINTQQDDHTPIVSPGLVLQNLQSHHTNQFIQQLASKILESKAYGATFNNPHTLGAVRPTVKPINCWDEDWMGLRYKFHNPQKKKSSIINYNIDLGGTLSTRVLMRDKKNITKVYNTIDNLRVFIYLIQFNP
eukprot:UN03657